MSPAENRPAPTGRATDPHVAQNPLPVLTAMGRALADVHRREPPPGLGPRTASEVAAAIDWLDTGRPLPRPYDRMNPATVRTVLDEQPAVSAGPVTTHGAPIVANVALVDGRAEFDDSDVAGLDPAERDLAIALRSIAETFTPESTVVFLDAYEEAGGSPPDGALLDWYAVVAAFR